uniref:Uncharacterized protein n=1 Tax=Cacopsylla melanoneura TaxID=428564 RepID=A0A8D8XBN7_9HEMI
MYTYTECLQASSVTYTWGSPTGKCDWTFSFISIFIHVHSYFSHLTSFGGYSLSLEKYIYNFNISALIRIHFYLDPFFNVPFSYPPLPYFLYFFPASPSFSCFSFDLLSCAFDVCFHLSMETYFSEASRSNTQHETSQNRYNDTLMSNDAKLSYKFTHILRQSFTYLTHKERYEIKAPYMTKKGR